MDAIEKKVLEKVFLNLMDKDVTHGKLVKDIEHMLNKLAHEYINTELESDKNEYHAWAVCLDIIRKGLE